MYLARCKAVRESDKVQKKWALQKNHNVAEITWNRMHELRIN